MTLKWQDWKGSPQHSTTELALENFVLSPTCSFSAAMTPQSARTEVENLSFRLVTFFIINPQLWNAPPLPQYFFHVANVLV